jgi:nicotinamide phosphoribosyltransferase
VKYEAKILSYNEREMFRRIVEDVYPSGIVSIVSDTWDFWNVLTTVLPALKSKIMARDGKVVVRPDSGDPVKIVTGYLVKEVHWTAEEYLARITKQSFHMKMWEGSEFDAVKTSDGRYFDSSGDELTHEEVLGAIHILHEVFGGKVNSKGYIELDPHIGLIYGDSITLSRCEQICERLARKGFASTNVVFGVGSYTYQYNTRDTFSLACKATWVKINGIGKPIFKDPKTDNGHKKSAKGLLRVVRIDGELVLEDNVIKELEETGELITVFYNGALCNEVTLSEVRKRLND